MFIVPANDFDQLMNLFLLLRYTYLNVGDEAGDSGQQSVFLFY